MMDSDPWVLPSSQSRLTGEDAERFERLRTKRQREIAGILRDERYRAIDHLLASVTTYSEWQP